MSSEVQSALDDSRHKTALWILKACAVIALFVGACGLLLPAQSFLAGAIALGAVCAGYFSVKARHPNYRIIVGQVAVAQAIALVAALEGTEWQIDAHMLFYVALAALIGMADIRAIILAAVTVVLHHLVLGVFVPQLVFPTFDLLLNLERAVFHGAIVALEVIALTLAVRMRLQLTAQVQNALTEAKGAMASANEAGARAQEARNDAEAEARLARTAQDKAEELVEGLRVEQIARERSDANARAVKEQGDAAQRALLDAQTHVVSALREGLERIAAGDLTGQITEPFPESYEALRHDYNRALKTLATVLGEVAESTHDLLGCVAGVGSSAEALASRTKQQMASLEATTMAVQALHGTVEASTENARATARAAVAVKSDAVAGGDMVRRVVDAMSEIEASSQEIAKINAVMDGIAFQTNLLALNAGVEAARAGTAGRGFSVVASEVRALSQRATDAARGINELTERSERQVRYGVDLVGQAGVALNGIVSSIAGMTDPAEQIAQAAEEQSNGLSAVSTSVVELDAVAQSNTAMFEETNTACQALTKGMERIAHRMQEFRLGHQHASHSLPDETAHMRDAS